MSDKGSNFDLTSLPPRLPQNRQELDRAILLLGWRKQVELSVRTRSDLVKLIGAYPTAEEAACWKRVLRRVVKISPDEAN